MLSNREMYFSKAAPVNAIAPITNFCLNTPDKYLSIAPMTLISDCHKIAKLPLTHDLIAAVLPIRRWNEDYRPSVFCGQKRRITGYDGANDRHAPNQR